VRGVCGKDAQTAALQDLLLHAVKGLGMYARRAREVGARDREVDVFALEALFATVTNVNFDAERIRGMILRAHELREDACPGCGCQPGDGVTEGCEHPEGCGFWRGQH